MVRGAHAVGILDEAAARLGLETIRDRNLTGHAYHEPLADEIYGRLRGYLSMMEAWLSVVERRAGPG